MKISPFEFIVIALAVYRLAYMAVKEDGPFGIVLGMRWLVGWRAVSIQSPNMPPKPALKLTWFDLHWFDKPKWLLSIVKTPADIFGCIYCASVWLGGIATLGYYLAPHETTLIALPLALSAAALVVHEKLVK